MSTPVNGPGDVAVGDLVEVDGDGAARTGVATVVKATTARLTVAWPDGTTTTAGYTRKVKRGPWDTIRRGMPATWDETNFARLGARDRWWRARPALADTRADYIGDIFRIGSDAIRDRPDDVIAQVRLLSDWLKAEPPKDAP